MDDIQALLKKCPSLERKDDMSEYLDEREYFVEAHFPSEEDARQFAYKMLDLGYLACKRDYSDRLIEESIKNGTYTDNAVRVPCDEDNILSPEFNKNIKKLARDFNGRCIRGDYGGQFYYSILSDEMLIHLESDTFNDSEEN